MKIPPLAILLSAVPLFGQTPPAAQYTGSAACKTCHPQVYARWSKTRMANVVRDPRERTLEGGGVENGDGFRHKKSEPASFRIADKK